jgi:hypothetical protein
MTDASGGNERPPQTDDARGSADEPAPPERPPLVDERRPPVLKAVPPPRSVRVSRALWLISFTAAAAAMLIAFLSHESIAAELEETLLRLSPGYDESRISTLVDVIYWACIAGLGVVVTLEAILLAMILNRRGGARWGQLVLLLVHAGVALVGSAFLTVTEFGLLVEVLLIGGFGCALAGWIAGLFPSAAHWFRTAGEVQPATLH